MKNIIKMKGWLPGALILLLAGMAGIITAGGEVSAASTMAGTKHNLSSSGSTNAYYSSGTDEICVFCHTPHAANTAANTPLWNRALSSSSYTAYSNSNSLDAAPGTFSGSDGSPSSLCLSCHDGTLALNTLLNYPGSGTAQLTMFNELGVNVTGDVKIASGRTTNLGADLSNDHPVNFNYNAALVTLDTTRSGNVPGLNDPTALTGVRLFGSGTDTKVQCASCHNPHDNTNGRFLRVSMSGSELCLKCHIK